MKKTLTLLFLLASFAAFSQSKIDASINELVDGRIGNIVDKVNKIPSFDGFDSILVIEANKTGNFNIDTLRLYSDGIVGFQLHLKADGALKSLGGKHVEVKRVSGALSVRQANLGLALSYSGVTWNVVRLDNSNAVVTITNTTGRAIKFSYQKIKL